MDVRIDPIAGVVERGDEAHRLVLDIAAGAVAVTVEDDVHRLRPLRWREKQLLARFARCGPALLTRQRVAVALDAPTDGSITALSDGTVELLAAVSTWLDDPEGLPLQPEALAGATVDVCRATGLRPADLDDRDAAEVEALWRASVSAPHRDLGLARAAPVARAIGWRPVVAPDDPWADATRIVFDDAASRSGRPLRGDSSTPRLDAGHDAEQQTMPAENGWTTGVRPAPAPARAAAETEQPAPLVVRSRQPRTPRLRGQATGGTGQPAVRAAAVAPPPPGPAAAARIGAAPAIPVPAPAVTPLDGVDRRAPAREPTSPPALGASVAGSPAPRVDRVTRTVAVDPPDAADEVAVPSASAGRFDDRALDDVVDAVVEALLDRLEESAADLGIEV